MTYDGSRVAWLCVPRKLASLETVIYVWVLLLREEGTTVMNSSKNDL
jgi:hypothetical protein